MNKFKLLLVKLLFRASDVLLSFAYHLQDSQINAPVNKPIHEGLVGYKNDCPYPFKNFRDGMMSDAFHERHKAASALVGWYLYQNGHPLVEDITLAARIFLEDTQYTEKDISFLVGAWMDQVRATTEEDKDAARAKEDEIYHRLFVKTVR